MGNCIEKTIRDVARVTEITTLKVVIIDILKGIDKDKRVEILKEMSEMYQSEIDTGLAEDR